MKEGLLHVWHFQVEVEISRSTKGALALCPKGEGEDAVGSWYLCAQLLTQF